MLTANDDEHKATAKKILLAAIRVGKVRDEILAEGERAAAADVLAEALDELATPEWIIWAAQVIYFFHTDEILPKPSGHDNS